MLKTKDILDEKDKRLKQISKEVTFPLTKADKEMIEKMIQFLKNSQIPEIAEKYELRPGMGLSAVQVGILKRVIVIDLEDDKGIYVFINPEIIKTKGSQECDEGCLSFPNKFGKVVRPTEVVVEFFNRKGKKDKLKAKDLLAQAICHECDHLEGILFVDKVLPGTLEYVTPEE